MGVKRSRRGPRTLDQSGAEMGGWFDWAGTSAAVDPVWTVDANDPYIMRAEVPAGTPQPNDIVGAYAGWPSPGVDTWIKQTALKKLTDRVQFASEAVTQIGEQMADVGAGVLSAGGTILKNIGPILLALAALFVVFEAKKK